ncbi:ATP-binding protein [Brachybacterium sp. DNPG3]
MQLAKLEISGFRSYVEPFEIEFEEGATSIVGRNDAGKSSILEALEAFFAGKVDPKDYSVNSSLPIAVSCEFTELPETVSIDANFSTTLAAEYLLTRSGSLRVTKEWSRGKPSGPKVSVLADHPTSDTVETNLLDLKQQGLKKVAAGRGISLEDVQGKGDARTNSAYRKAIWDQVLESGDASLVEREVQLSKEDGLDVAKALEKYYPYFHLFRSDRASDENEPIAQDPIKLIVKEVLEQHSAQLNEFATVIEGEVNRKLKAVVGKLAEVAPDMAATLRAQDLAPKWTGAYGKAQFIDENDVPLSRRGSGTRRLVLLSFFRAEAEREVDEDHTTYHRGVLTAVEEPETALHSDLQRQILSSLLDVADQPNRQVILTTHSSNLLRDVPATSIRYIRSESGKKSCVSADSSSSGQELLSALNSSLGIFTDHNVRCFVLIEGRRDKEGIVALTESLHANTDEGVVPFYHLESQGRVAFMPIGGGGNLSLWESNLSEFNRHEVYVVDSDRESVSSPLKKEVIGLQTREDTNRTVVVLERRELENYLTFEAICSAYADLSEFERLFREAIGTAGEWDYVDIPSIAAEAAHEANPAAGQPWLELSESKRSEKESAAKKRLAKAFRHESVAKSLVESDCDLMRTLRRINDLAR